MQEWRSVVTNLYLNEENIWRRCNRGAIAEQIIDEIKSASLFCYFQSFISKKSDFPYQNFHWQTLKLNSAGFC